MREYAVERITGLIETFEKELAKASKHGDEDAVHDLRVSIRRLRATLRTFQQYFPEPRVKRVRRRLRRLMEFAGEVRDRDIVLNLLTEAGLAQSDLAAGIRRGREDAGKDLRSELRRWKKRDDAAKWPQRLHLANPSGGSIQHNGNLVWDDAGDAMTNAREKLPQLAEEYIRKGTALATPESTVEELHGLRLATKHFRYTLEAFRPVYGERLESWVTELKEVQTYLGDINDCRVARERYASEIATAPFLEFLDGRLARLRTEFQEYWRLHFAAPDRVEAWRKFLGPLKPVRVSSRRTERDDRQAKAV